MLELGHLLLKITILIEIGILETACQIVQWLDGLLDKLEGV